MKGYKMNFATGTLTISREFAKKALVANSPELQIIERCRAVCPALKIAYFIKREPKQKRYGGLTFEKMQNYINLFDNADELMEQFHLVRDAAQLQRNKFNFVYKWFVQQFPNYKEVPEIVNGRLRSRIIVMPELEKKAG